MFMLQEHLFKQVLSSCDRISVVIQAMNVVLCQSLIGEFYFTTNPTVAVGASCDLDFYSSFWR